MSPRREAPSPDDVERCLRTLEALSALEPSALRQVPQVGRVLAAGYSLARRAGRSLRDPTWQCPTAAVDNTPSPPPAPPPPPAPRRRCYTCRATFRAPSPTVHLCPDCDAAQTLRRARSADLHGRVALVTGARIRIGYAVSLRLLRAGATVHATTRFAHDALARYAAETDFDAWSARLHLHALDLCDLRAVLAWIETLTASLPRLDVLINNAARTIDHPAAWIDAMRARARPGGLVAPRRTPALGRAAQGLRRGSVVDLSPGR